MFYVQLYIINGEKGGTEIASVGEFIKNMHNECERYISNTCDEKTCMLLVTVSIKIKSSSIARKKKEVLTKECLDFFNRDDIYR